MLNRKQSAQFHFKHFWQASEASEILFRCTECKFAIYVCNSISYTGGTRDIMEYNSRVVPRAQPEV